MVRNQRVVIIEDSKLNREELKTELAAKHRDFEVVGEAVTAEKGFSLIEDKQPNGVFLDINLPSENRGERAGVDLANNIVRLENAP